jgi:hypothetical protein
MAAEEDSPDPSGKLLAKEIAMDGKFSPSFCKCLKMPRG